MLTTNTKSLRDALSLCKLAVEVRGTVPILSHVRLTAAADRVTVTATDMEVAFVLPVEASGDSMDVCVPFKQFAGLVTGYKGATIGIEAFDGSVRVHVGAMASNLLTLPVKDFPGMTEGTLPAVMGLPAPVLRDAFAVPQHAISTEETRYSLRGVFMRVNGDGLTTVATDGHRLARMVTPKPDGVADGAPAIIVPCASVACISAFCGKSSNSMAVEWSDLRLKVTRPDGGIMVTKLIDESFPEYERVIPRDHPYRMTAPAGALAETIKRVARVSSEKSRPVKLTIGGDAIEVTASSAETGSASERINGKLVSAPGDGFEIGFQARYLQDMLAWCGETVEGAFEGVSGGGSPAVFRPAGDASRTFVLMPMRV